MKNSVTTLALALFATTVIPSISHALVSELANCSTRDGKYQIAVLDNQGIGLVRTSHITATIVDQNGQTIANFDAEKYSGFQSASFGRPKYQDTKTQGTDFSLEGPSTNLHRYDLTAIVNGQQISELDLDCAVFGGEVLGE